MPKLRQRAVRLVEQVAGAASPAADQALVEAGGDVKTAIVMLRLGLTADAARARLAHANGRLRQVLGE